MDATFSQAITDLKTDFVTFCDAEESRITKEVTFLKKIYDSLSDGAALELVSTNASSVFLTGSLDAYLPR